MASNAPCTSAEASPIPRMTGRACIIRQYFYDLQLRRESESLRDAGFDVDVICLQEDGRGSEEEIDGVHLYRTPLSKKRGSFLRYVWDYFSFFIYAGLKVTRLHLRHRYRVVQATSMPDFLVFATVIPRLLGAKTVAFLKEPTPELGQTLYGRKWVTAFLKVAEQLALRYANVVFTVTQQLKDTYVSRGADAKKIHVILNAPDSRHLLAFASSNAVPDPNYFTLIYHGSIEERYGHDTVLRAMAIARQKVPNLRLRLIGSGEYVDTVLRMIDELGLGDCVQFLGFVSREELSDELAKADAGLVAQKSSAYSNLVHTTKMYEYMMFGKPAIISRLKSVAAYFGADSMCYFEPDDPQSLADAVVDLYEHPEKRRSLVENARKLYEVHRWDEQRKTYLRVIGELLGRG